MICCCSLAGTVACKTCFNNPDADLTNIKSNYVIKTNIFSPELNKIYTPVKVKPTIQYWCDYCDSVLTPHQKYCHNCGKEIDWSEIFKDEQ